MSPGAGRPPLAGPSDREATSPATAGKDRPLRRPVARGVVLLGIWVLAGLSAVRLPLDYLPVWTFPELRITLHLPEGHDLDQVTRELVQPIEAAVRSIGGVHDMAGRVGERGGDLRVRLAPGTDPESVAAWLDSDLRIARRALPEGGELRIDPAGRSRDGVSTVLWLPEDPAVSGTADQAFAEALRRLPEVREVRAAEEGRRELWIRASVGDVVDLRQSLGQARASLGLGQVEQGGRLARIRVAETGSIRLPELPVAVGRGLLRLGGAGEVELERGEPQLLVRHRGQDGRAYLIYREHGASPLALEASLRRLLGRWGLEGDARVLFDDAAPLRRLLVRLLAGLAGSSLLIGLAWGLLAGPRTGLLQALAPITCLAGALIVTPLATVGLDVTTLPALALGVATGLLFQLIRGPRRPESRRSAATGLGAPRAAVFAGLVWTLLAAFCLPTAVALIGGTLAGLLSAPSLLFAVTAPAACAAGLVIPPPSSAIRGEAAALLRWVLRRPWPLLLGGASFAYAMIVLLGAAMVPKPGSLSPLPADIGVDIDFGASRGSGESAAVMAHLEKRLDGLDEIDSFWSVTGRGWGYLGVWARSGDRDLVGLRALADRLRSRLGGAGATIRVAPFTGLGGREPLRFESSLGHRAEDDPEKGIFRFLLSSSEALPLRRAVQRAEQDLLALYWSPDREAIQVEWAPPSTRFRLGPGIGVGHARANRLASTLAELAREPPRLGVPILPRGDSWPVVLRVAHPRAPNDPQEVVGLRELLGPLPARDDVGAVSPTRLLEVREEMAAPGIDRHRGSFVVPITVRFTGVTLGEVPRARWQLISTLERLRLPPGV
ncbi:MAG: efflux RND transporter permease subunit, partial [Holophagales bacterium]|nr:efflux RND transporter permease subunit [Holophagales bacterium]